MVYSHLTSVVALYWNLLVGICRESKRPIFVAAPRGAGFLLDSEVAHLRMGGTRGPRIRPTLSTVDPVAQ
jgi:hypothetical protein